jgi:hypothetical protein
LQQQSITDHRLSFDQTADFDWLYPKYAFDEDLMVTWRRGHGGGGRG